MNEMADNISNQSQLIGSILRKQESSERMILTLLQSMSKHSNDKVTQNVIKIHRSKGE